MKTFCHFNLEFCVLVQDDWHPVHQHNFPALSILVLSKRFPSRLGRKGRKNPSLAQKTPKLITYHENLNIFKLAYQMIASLESHFFDALVSKSHTQKIIFLSLTF